MKLEKKVKLVTLKTIIFITVLFSMIDSLSLFFDLDKRIYLFELLFLIFYIIITFRLAYFYDDTIVIITPFGKKRLFYSQIKRIEFCWNTMRGEEGYCLTIYTKDDEFLLKRFLTTIDYNRVITFLDQKKIHYNIKKSS